MGAARVPSFTERGMHRRRLPLSAPLVVAGVGADRRRRLFAEPHRRSLFFLDPDRHKLEIHVGNAQSRIAQMRREDWEGLELFSEDEDSSVQSK